jgi:hypothetical protein
MNKKFNDELQQVVLRHMVEASTEGPDAMSDVITSLLEATAATVLTYSSDNKTKQRLLVDAVAAQFRGKLERGIEVWDRARDQVKAKQAMMSDEDIEEELRKIGIKA